MLRGSKRLCAPGARKGRVSALDSHTGRTRLEVITPASPQRLHCRSSQGSLGWTQWVPLFDLAPLMGSLFYDEPDEFWDDDRRACAQEGLAVLLIGWHLCGNVANVFGAATTSDTISAIAPEPSVRKPQLATPGSCSGWGILPPASALFTVSCSLPDWGQPLQKRLARQTPCTSTSGPQALPYKVFGRLVAPILVGRSFGI